METPEQDQSAAIELLHHVEGLIALGEQRANIVAAGNAALLVVYSTGDIFKELINSNRTFGFDWASVCALIAMFFSLVAIVPQLKSTLFSRWTSPSSYFFGCIGDMSEATFVDGYMERNNDEHIRRTLRAVHMRSRKAKVKFTMLTIATIATPLQFLPIVEAVWRGL